MYEKLPFNLTADFAPISMMGSTPFVLGIHPSLPVASVRELVDYAKTRPGELRYGSGGSGSPPHLSAEIFKSMTGINLMHIPYKGVTPAMTDAPAGTPRAIVAKVNAEVSRALKQPELVQRLSAAFYDTAAANAPEQFAIYIRQEIAKWAKLVKETGAKVD